ncbi:cytokine-dependent hematopoietic cell linker isoform X2 [Artibeus jamaicensis]|uniref:cytokine-dependent hematopoietic cell linker isoform X2 n=1 Tax=Artibeus jamaicensis TaxID=9417 RepID=UPI00235A84BF|nr:cytokine-dependent hematopoietic cell linker isoform X2 [Artibeus jamaicensis]
MNKQDNGRERKEGSGDLKFPSTATVPKTRSWPRACSANGQFQAVDESLLNYEMSLPEALDAARDPGDDDYEAPRLPVASTWQLMKILPARPLKESEYADTRCFEDVGGPPLPLDGTRSLPTERQTWNMQVDRPISKDVRSQHVQGDKPTKRNKIPPPPPRLPVLPPKKYQPLPPEPESGRSPLPQRHTFPEVQRGPRQISLKNLSEVLGTEKVPYHQMKPQASHLSQNQSSPEVPHAIPSSSFMTSSHSTQNRDHKGSTQSLPPQRCQSPADFSPWEHSVPASARSGKKPLPTRPDGKAAQHSRWYVGECSRQEVEEALLKENKDGTFLVRDCSVKSRTEPYVLVVFYGNRVYNVKIRFLERSQQFVLGTGRRGSEFDSVEDIIEHYRYFPIVLIDGKDKTGAHREQCYLTRPLPLSRLASPC